MPQEGLLKQIFTEIQKFTLDGRKSPEMLLDNRIIFLLCRNPEASVSLLRQRMREAYSVDVHEEDLLTALHTLGLKYEDTRKRLFVWTGSMVELFTKALHGDAESFKLFSNKRKEILDRRFGERRNQDRCLVLAIYSALRSEISKVDRGICTFMEQSLEGLSNGLGTRYLNSFLYTISKEYGFALSGSVEVKISSLGALSEEEREHIRNVFRAIKNTSSEDKTVDLREQQANRIICCLCLEPTARIPRLQRFVSARSGLRMENRDIFFCLRRLKIAYTDSCEKEFNFIHSMIEHADKFLRSNKESFDYFVENKKRVVDEKIGKRRNRDRFLLMGVYVLLKELGLLEYEEVKNFFGNLDIDNFDCSIQLNALINAIALEYQYGSVRVGIQFDSLDQAILKVMELEMANEQMTATIERTDAMLKDLQDEFEEQLQESKVQELTDFFSRLNSDNYGRILDEAFMLRKGITQLRKDKYEVPETINGILIMTNNLLKFIKESHIDPQMKVGSIVPMRVQDVELCEYDGTPFVDEEETKQVLVVSPGWVYRDKEVQISRPKVKEVTEE